MDDSDEEEEADVEAETSMVEFVDSEDQLIKKLVRYALACEYSRQPIRREGVRDKGKLQAVKILPYIPTTHLTLV